MEPPVPASLFCGVRFKDTRINLPAGYAPSARAKLAAPTCRGIALAKPEAYRKGRLLRQNMHAFQEYMLILYRFSGIALFSSASRGGKILCASVWVERTKRAGG